MKDEIKDLGIWLVVGIPMLAFADALNHFAFEWHTWYYFAGILNVMFYELLKK